MMTRQPLTPAINATVQELRKENADLIHDMERARDCANQTVNENEALRERVRELEATLLKIAAAARDADGKNWMTITDQISGTSLIALSQKGYKE